MPTAARCQSEPQAARTRRVRVGIIGLGVGEAHISGYRDHPACDVAALCDLSAARLAEIGARNPGPTLHECPENILNDPAIDVVSIASYDDWHYEQVVAALSNGKHVFVEKPLCLRIDEARRIRALLRQNPHVRLSSNLILRRCPRFCALKRMIDRGEFGELFLLEGNYLYGRLHKLTHGWRGRISDYSVVLGGAVHIVDLLLWLTGDRVVEVAARGNGIATRGSAFRGNDTVTATLRFESGIVAQVGVSYGCMRPHFHALDVFGTRATFVNGQPHALLYRSRDPAAPVEHIDTPYPGVHKGALLAGFIDTIFDGAPPVVSEEDVLSTMSVCFAIEQATATGHTQKVEYV